MADLQGKLLEAKREKARRLQTKFSESKKQPSLMTKFPGALGGLVDSATTGFNEGMIDVANLPAQGLDWLLEKFGLPATGGAEALKELTGRLGMTSENSEYPIISRITQEVGGASVPLGVGLSAAKYAKSSPRAIAPIINALKNRPGTASLEELASATSSGIGAGVAREVAPESDVGEMVGQLVGGFASPMSNIGSATRLGGRGLRKAVEPLTPGGAKRSAAKQLSKIMETDPDEAVRILRRPQDATPGADLTPAQELDDSRLKQLEVALGKHKGDVEERLAGKAAKTQQSVRMEADDLKAGGSSQQAQEYYQGRIDRAVEQADDIINRAALKAKEKIENLPDGTKPEEASRIARESIDDAYRQARDVERSLWGQVDETATASTKPLYETYEQLQGSLKKAQQMPSEISEHLGKNAGENMRLLDEESLGEVKAFRTKLREARMAEEALESPNRNKIRILNEMEDAALEAMESSSAANSEAFQAARDYSRQLNQKFKEGVIGKIRAQAKRGGDKTPAGQTLDQVIKAGSEGGENLDRLVAVAGDDPQALNAVKSYIKERFVQQVTDNQGVVSPRAAKRFMDRNQAVLDRLPDLKKQLSDTKQAQEVADKTTKRMGTRKASITDKNKSRAALFVDGGIKKVLNSKKPKESISQLVRQAKADKTGGAIKGLKAEFIDTMMDSAQKGKGGVVSGQNLDEFIQKNKEVAKELFSSEELSRINQMARTARKVESALKTGRSVQEVLDESPDMIVDLVSRIVGANVGAAGAAGSVGAPIVAAGAGSRFVRSLTNKIPMGRTRDVLTEAILDRDKMRDLLTKVHSGSKAKDLERKMNAWLVNLIPTEQEETNQK